MISRKLIAYASAVLALVTTHAAFAAPVIFFGENQAAGGASVSGNPVAARNAFLAGLAGSVKSEGFEGFTDLQKAPLDLSFTGSSGNISATLKGAGTIFNTPGAGRFNTTSGGSNLFELNGGFEIDFGISPVSAFGFYGTDIGDFNGRLTIALTDESDAVTNLEVGHTVNGADGSLLFWGFIDTTTKYKKITFGNTSTDVDIFGFDDMVVGDLGQVVPNPVPAPATLGLAGLALLGLAMTRRRRR